MAVQKEVVWLMRMTDNACNSLELPVAHVNQPGVIFASDRERVRDWLYLTMLTVAEIIQHQSSVNRLVWTIGYWLNDTVRRKWKCLEKNLAWCHFVHAHCRL
jgi:hypothetical protein